MNNDLKTAIELTISHGKGCSRMLQIKMVIGYTFKTKYDE